MHTAVTKDGLCDECAALDAEPVIRISQPRPQPRPAPGPPAALRSPVGLSYAVLALLGVWTVGDLAMIATGRWGSDRVHDLAVQVQGPVFFACAITFMVWFHRVRVNAEVFAPDGHRKSRTWAYWGWIVPVVNLWYPRRIAIDTWVASARRLPDGSAPPASYQLINIWWICWLLSNVAFYSSNGGAPDGWVGFSSVADIASAVAAACFVRQLTRRQDVLVRTGPVVAAA
ncbi:DUF4328 domain-containing protein [Streptomyces beijiangensis]|uniref:DUF4328 domain-containing protein n=1 Tax=Streptomyces beijiangensis TaxID=163361 RepID=A0A939F418_9ACTN|nr:DUF4328 domain-containing protein [Streptomyces beijiangensis]MBO0510657.1 DUF4328 domain-containing protein [Streptomyces beijiangensis]